MSAPVETFQAEWELEQLVALVKHLQPESVLEIGAWHGGTLWHWMQNADVVAVVDNLMQRVDEWREWELEARCESLHLIQGLSQDPAIVEAVRRTGPYDFAFIDGDHRYEAVKADWENYRTMARVVAFHDIIERPGYGVSQVWGEITSQPGTRWMEIGETQEPENESRCGIGVVWT